MIKTASSSEERIFILSIDCRIFLAYVKTYAGPMLDAFEGVADDCKIMQRMMI